MYILTDPVNIEKALPSFVRWKNDHARKHPKAAFGTQTYEIQTLLNTICSELESGNLLRAVFWMGSLNAYLGGNSAAWTQAIGLENQANARLA
jgi:hypothetical protein